MHYLLKVSFPVAAGNAALTDPQFGEKMQRLLAEIKAEATYFTSINGQRGAYIVVNMEDASEIPGIAEYKKPLSCPLPSFKLTTNRQPI